MKKITNKLIVENFYILLSSLYEHKSIDEIKKMSQNFSKDVKNISGKGNAVVELNITYKDGTTETKKMMIEDAVKYGLEMSNDVASFYVTISVVKTTRVDNVAMSAIKELFKSSKFIIKENWKKVENETDAIIIKDMLFYQEKTGNRIRFGNENIVEI